MEGGDGEEIIDDFNEYIQAQADEEELNEVCDVYKEALQREANPYDDQPIGGKFHFYTHFLGSTASSMQKTQT